MRCRSSARELRHLRARFGDTVEIAAVALDADRQNVESFLRWQRVAAPVRYVSRRDTTLPEGLRWPALYLTRGDRIEAVYLGVPLDDTRSIQKRNVEAVVASLLGRSGAKGSVREKPSSFRSNS